MDGTQAAQGERSGGEAGAGLAGAAGSPERRREAFRGPRGELALAPLAELEAHPENVRLHGDRDLGVLRASLARFGQLKPVVVQASTRYVVAGNGTLEAARQLGWTHLQANVVDLSDADARAYALVDNRSAELSTWDIEGLSRQLHEAQDRGDELVFLCWDESEAGPLLAADFTPPAVDPDAQFDFATKMHHVAVTAEQYAVFERARNRVRALEDNPDLSDGRCLELICADYLAGPGGE